MTNPPMLSFLYFSKDFVIKCDASGHGIGIVLMQDNRPLVFRSQPLKGKNLLLSTYEKELLALVVAIKKWRLHLIGTTFIIRTDYHSLKYLLE